MHAWVAQWRWSVRVNICPRSRIWIASYCNGSAHRAGWWFCRRRSAPDGTNVAENWQRMGVEHFTKLGARVTPVTVLTRADADSAAMAEQIAAANFVYLSGGKPRYLLETLHDSACWRAIQSVHAAGGVVAGCSAGAMALGEMLFDFPQIWRTVPALGLARGVAIIPHFDEMPGIIRGRIGPASKTIPTAGVEGNTALVVSAEGEWRVEGRGGVTLFEEGQPHTRYATGQVIPRGIIPPPARR